MDAYTLAVSKCKEALETFNTLPLWARLAVGGACLLVVKIRQLRRQFDDSGIEVILQDYGAKFDMGDNGFLRLGEIMNDRNYKTVGYTTFGARRIASMDDTLIKQVFTTHFHAFPHRMPTDASFGAGEIGNVQMNTVKDIHTWKRLRSTLSPGFSTRQLDVMYEQTKIVIRHLLADLEKRKSEPVRGSVVSGKFAIDAFLQSAMSIDLQSENLERMEDFVETDVYRYMAMALLPNWKLMACFVLPFFGELVDFLGFSTMDGIWWVRDFIRQILTARSQEKSGRKNDFVNIMLDNQISENESRSSTRGLTHTETISQIFTFFGAGYETTQNSLNWVFYFLAKHSDIQEKVRQEVQKVDELEGKCFGFDKLPWLSAVHAEVLRIRPPVAVHFRKCDSNVTVNNIKFKKGDMFYVPIVGLHTNEEYLGDKATEFSPERFVDNPDLVKEWFYVPFGGGPRNCIGMRFALMQGRACIAHIVKNFQVRFSDEFVDDVEICQMGLFTKPTKPLHFVFDKIN